MLATPKGGIVEIIRKTARFGEKYALAKYDSICAAAKDAAVFGRAFPSNALRIRLYIKMYREYQAHLDSILEDKPFEIITPEKHCEQYLAAHPDKAQNAAYTAQQLNLQYILTADRQPGTFLVNITVHSGGLQYNRFSCILKISTWVVLLKLPFFISNA